jgi:hypothetical protein
MVQLSQTRRYVACHLNGLAGGYRRWSRSFHLSYHLFNISEADRKITKKKLSDLPISYVLPDGNLAPMEEWSGGLDKSKKVKPANTRTHM